MKLAELTVTGFADIVSSDAPAPGGGSVSALTAAQGIGLVGMVAALTIGKERYRDFEAVCIAAKAEADALCEKLTLAIDKDTEAFNLVSAAYKLPKDTEELKAARSKAIADALEKADPDHKDIYQENASAYSEKLKDLDAKYQEVVDGASQKTLLFGDRFPFRYLVDDYGLSYYAALVG